MAKAPTTPPPGPTAGRRMWLLGAVVAVVAVAGVLLANRGNSDGPPQIGHVHGLAVNPADGQLYVAAHNGVFQLPAGDEAVRVGDGAQDTMGFTVVGPDHFMASGHPAPLQGGPDHLGLIESTDAGVSWSTLSLAGEADFHALSHVHDTTYGYNSLTGQFMGSYSACTPWPASTSWRCSPCSWR